jgi:chloramphenicol 3-O phosphotransferase
MAVDVIVVSGGSSSGRSSIATELQTVLPEHWLTLGIETFIGALAHRMSGNDAGIQFEANGQLGVGSEFARLEAIWMTGVAAKARAGAKLIVVDGFLSGPRAQQR